MNSPATNAAAQRIFDIRQKIVLVLLITTSSVLIVVNWFGFLLVAVGLCTVTYALVTTAKLTLLGRLLRSSAAPESSVAENGRDLPFYTILVPLYREANVVGRLIESLRALDYSADRLQILLLVEPDDDETHQALTVAKLEPPFEVVVVSDASPKTKPKACNEGLSRTTGEHLVIYDAEDPPEPDQLRKAVAAFESASDPSIACWQAVLSVDNARQNLLTRLFQLEYAFWFRLMLPALARWRAPVPLGGSSNHFKTDVLKCLGGWDPYNVAEDCDLGIRLHRAGYRVGMLDSMTYEEAPVRVGQWLRQRSRWLKGYMQTFLVHTRTPLRFIAESGVGQFLNFSLLIGATPLLCLLNPVFWSMFLWHSFTGSDFIESLFPGIIGHIGLFNLVSGNPVFIYLLMVAAIVSNQKRLIPEAFLAPIGWALMSVAAWMALWELVFKPHYWQKTAHGTGKRDEEAP